MARRRLTRAEQKERTRKRLLEAATRVLARRGFHAAGVDEVAEAAGLTKGAIYAHFRDKEELFFACFDDFLQARMQELETAGRPGPAARRPEAVARDVGNLFGLFMGERLGWFLVFVEFLSHAGRSRRLRRRLAPRLAEIEVAVARLVEAQAQQMKRPLPASAELIAASAISLTDGFALRRLVDPKSFSPEKYQAMLGFFFQGVASLSDAAREGAPE